MYVITSITVWVEEAGEKRWPHGLDTKWDRSPYNHDEWKREDMSAPHPHLMNGIIYTYLAKERE